MTGSNESKENRPADSKCGYDQALVTFTGHFGRETAVSLLDEFVEAIEELIPDLEAKMRTRDMLQVTPLTHRLIGLCPVYKAGRLADLGHMMEQEMRRGDWLAVESHNQQLRAAFAEYMGR